MFRQICKVLEPVRRQLVVAVRGEADAPVVRGTDTTAAAAGAAGAAAREDRLAEALRRSLPGLTYLSIEDISGGCGAMFEVSVEAKEFNGLSRVKQHRLVTESLKSEIAEMHGIRIHTMVSKTDK